MQMQKKLQKKPTKKWICVSKMENEEDMQIDARSLSSPTLKIKQKKKE